MNDEKIPEWKNTDLAIINRIAALMDRGVCMTTREVADHVGCSRETAYAALRQLQREYPDIKRVLQKGRLLWSGWACDQEMYDKRISRWMKQKA